MPFGRCLDLVALGTLEVDECPYALDCTCLVESTVDTVDH